MHLAIVIESSYRENEQLAELPGAHASAELVSARLTQAGFVVERIPASRELAGYLDERLLGATSPLTSLLVYYVGYVALNPERGPALLLDGPRLRAFPVSRVARAIMGAAYSGAFVVDAVAVPEPNQTAQQIARSIVDVVPAEGRVATLVAAKEPDPARAWMPSRLSDLFVLGLDWLDAAEADPRTVTLAALSRVMREERISYARVGATASHFGEDATRSRHGRRAAPRVHSGTRRCPPSKIRSPRPTRPSRCPPSRIRGLRRIRASRCRRSATRNRSRHPERRFRRSRTGHFGSRIPRPSHRCRPTSSRRRSPSMPTSRKPRRCRRSRTSTRPRKSPRRSGARCFPRPLPGSG
jgi:hypothetical protein